MKFTETFEKHLLQRFENVHVRDGRGDGHYVEMICIDPVFTDMSRIRRSRYIFDILGGFVNSVHALSVRGFSPTEWETKKDTFTPTEYQHIR